jgi:hypothetical protein
MKKNILIIAGIVALVVIVGVWQLLANLDSIVAGVIEESGSEVLKTDVSVSGVSIDLKGGKAAIAGMTIANPDGYSNALLFEMEDIAVDLDLNSLNEDVLVINAIRIKNPKINFEGTADGGSNMQTLMENINSSASESNSETKSDELLMIINNFELSGAQVKAISEMKPGEPTEINLPPIKMSGIGKNQGGVTAEVVAQEITHELISTVLNAAAKAGVQKAIEKKKQGFLDKLKGNN